MPRRRLSDRIGLPAILALSAGLGVARAEVPTPADAPRPLPLERASKPRLSATFQGSNQPGGSLTLVAEVPEDPSIKVRWVQTRGPVVRIDEPTARKARVAMPEGGEGLGFLLIVGGPGGVESIPLAIPTAGDKGATDEVVADAGDDQVGLAGRLLTLNGSRSKPSGRLSYRWVQVGGPAAVPITQDGYVAAFVPNVPGAYRFLLVVAGSGMISEPDYVEVTVGHPPANPPANPPPAAPQPAAPPPPTVDQMTHSGLASIEGGSASAEALATAFDSVAARMELYANFEEVFSETSRHLASILPEDPARRSTWMDRLFKPLSARLIYRLRAEGLDLARAEGQTAPLTASQRLVLAEFYSAASRGFRASKPPR